jgi:hypothetical protein
LSEVLNIAIERERMCIATRIHDIGIIVEDHNGFITPFIAHTDFFDRHQATWGCSDLPKRGDVAAIFISKTKLASTTDVSDGVKGPADIRFDGLQYTFDTEILI